MNNSAAHDYRRLDDGARQELRVRLAAYVEQ